MSLTFVPSEDEKKQWYDRLTPEEKEAVNTLALHAVPVISTEGDFSEFELSEWDEFDDSDEVELSSKCGPVIVKLEVICDDAVIVSVTRTFFWEGNPESSILMSCLGLARDKSLDVIETAVDLSTLDEEGVIGDCLLASSESLRIESVDVKFLTALSSSRPVAMAELMTLHGRPQVGQTLGVLFIASVELSSKETFFVGFEDIVTYEQGASSLVLSVDEAGLLVPITRSIEEQGRKRVEMINKLHTALEPLETIAGIEPIDICQLVLKAKVKNDRSLSSLHRLGWMLVCNSIPEKKFLQSARAFSYMRDLRANGRYAFSDAQLVERQNQFAHTQIRSGKWKESIDSPALARARDVVAQIFGVTSHEIVRIGRWELSSMLPTTIEHPHLGAMTLDLQGETKFDTLRTLYLLYSRRLLPWSQIEKNDKLLSYTKSKIMHHISDTVIQAPVERVNWKMFEHQAKGRTILNDAARSGVEPFASLAIGQNDWAVWRDHFNRATSAEGVKGKILAYIMDRITEGFPRARLTRSQSRALAVNLVDRLAVDANRVAAGEVSVRERLWTDKEFLQIAICLYALKQGTLDPDEPSPAMSRGTILAIARQMPTRTYSSISAALNTHWEPIGNAYKLLRDQIHSHGLEYMCDDLDPAEIRLAYQCGLGEDDENDLDFIFA
ncbi:hypothetical protein CI109_105493 [Kwoniella shandongensis]|uniref:Uncharacterized protein n=1 Tax=Kwoniella shandongensis TaxID=1734106 RepID=A0AAJ8MZF0_9TREE